MTSSAAGSATAAAAATIVVPEAFVWHVFSFRSCARLRSSSSRTRLSARQPKSARRQRQAATALAGDAGRPTLNAAAVPRHQAPLTALLCSATRRAKRHRECPLVVLSDFGLAEPAAAGAAAPLPAAAAAAVNTPQVVERPRAAACLQGTRQLTTARAANCTTCAAAATCEPSAPSCTLCATAA